MKSKQRGLPRYILKKYQRILFTRVKARTVVVSKRRKLFPKPLKSVPGGWLLCKGL